MDGAGGFLRRGAEAGQPRAGIGNKPGSIPGGELQGLFQNQIPSRLQTLHRIIHLDIEAHAYGLGRVPSG